MIPVEKFAVFSCIIFRESQLMFDFEEMEAKLAADIDQEQVKALK